MQRDFDYIFELVSNFFERRHIQKGLRLINQNDVTGWEIWLQIEFSCFLTEHESEPEWWREKAIEYDYRSEREKYFLKPDFVIRKKGWRTDSYAALEIKQHRESGSCVNNMVKDMVRVAKARRSELDIRSYWAIGVMERESKSEVRRKLEKRIDTTNLELVDSCVEMRVIPNTRHMYLLF
ncbi:hypothetical protein [Chromohalobacter israelensis]|uniref:hypothetical protein n=1 Tax=Chromohalobacter israelensis TaxID=141390 RepID=UPI00265B7820|nr:hypothetical protein [Chromohalobacter salexigens]MDO0946110.1 hypothetical protein [Chromohalobacter salexigens]